MLSNSNIENSSSLNIDCKQGYTQDNIVYEFGKDDISLRKCDGCNHFTFDGELCSCDYIK